mmetsp:Transcript_12027/g.38066  ORF Transcript_12027/g.38066 Transcript_12027/m.38066 type:complete len:238 (+) Transcript_12027:656-1369(+)
MPRHYRIRDVGVQLLRSHPLPTLRLRPLSPAPWRRNDHGRRGVQRQQGVHDHSGAQHRAGRYVGCQGGRGGAIPESRPGELHPHLPQRAAGGHARVARHVDAAPPLQRGQVQVLHAPQVPPGLPGRPLPADQQLPVHLLRGQHRQPRARQVGGHPAPHQGALGDRRPGEARGGRKRRVAQWRLRDRVLGVGGRDLRGVQRAARGQGGRGPPGDLLPIGLSPRPRQLRGLCPLRGLPC